MVCGPDQPTEKFVGTESVRALGELWVLCEGRSELPGGGMATTLMTLGYESGQNAFVGTWVGSMMTWLWVYSGSLDPAERILTLTSEGPDFSGQNKLTTYRDAIEFLGEDHRVLRSQRLGDDGEWHQIMMADYKRRS
jgi:hypothetical protein